MFFPSPQRPNTDAEHFQYVFTWYKLHMRFPLVSKIVVGYAIKLCGS